MFSYILVGDEGNFYLFGVLFFLFFLLQNKKAMGLKRSLFGGEDQARLKDIDGAQKILAREGIRQVNFLFT